MLKIQVLGKGMIPRGYGLAPRLDPFPADFTLASTIMATPGLILRYLHPETGELKELNKKNIKRVYEKWGNAIYNKPAQKTETTTQPHVPYQKPAVLNEQPPVQPQAPSEPVKVETIQPEPEPQQYHTKVEDAPAVETEKAESADTKEESGMITPKAPSSYNPNKNNGNGKNFNNHQNGKNGK